MKYAVDKIENDIAVLENIETGKKLEINTINLPKNIKEKDILKYEDGKYFLDSNEKNKRINRIKEKMEKLKNGGFYEWIY